MKILRTLRRNTLWGLLFITGFAYAQPTFGQTDTTRQKGNGLHFFVSAMSGINKYSLAPNSYYGIDNHYGSYIAGGIGIEYKKANRYLVSIGSRFSQRRGYSQINSGTDGLYLMHNQTSLEIPVFVGYQFNSKARKELLTLYIGGIYTLTSMETIAASYYSSPSYTYVTGPNPKNSFTTSMFSGSIKLSKEIAKYKPVHIRLFGEMDFQLSKAEKGLTLYFNATTSNPTNTNPQFMREVNLLSRSIVIGVDLLF